MGHRASHVFRWDLDKTYLRSEFETLRDLVKSAMEKPTDKIAYPGAAALLRALRASFDHRICIVSGSPSQMRQVLSAKLALDGVEYDEFVLKNNLRNLLRGRFRALRSQIPYKLPALLESRAGLLGTPPETLFGDDAEADAIIYCLYADLLAGVVRADDLPLILKAARAYPDEIDRTVALAEQVQTRCRDSVERVLINLDRRSPTAIFQHFGARLVPIYNYFQAAILLYVDHVLSARQVVFVGKEMLDSGDFAVSGLANSFQDLLRRGRVTKTQAHAFTEELRSEGAGEILGDSKRPLSGDIAAELENCIRTLGSAFTLKWPERSPTLDYVELVDREYRHRTAS